MRATIDWAMRQICYCSIVISINCRLDSIIIQKEIGSLIVFFWLVLGGGFIFIDGKIKGTGVD